GAATACRDDRASRSAGLDPCHGRHARPGSDLHGGPVRRGAAAVLVVRSRTKGASMGEKLLRAYVGAMIARAALRDRLVRDEAGEGVISAAIAVLIMAFLGALMWIAFKQIFANASDKTANQVNQIGS